MEERCKVLSVLCWSLLSFHFCSGFCFCCPPFLAQQLQLGAPARAQVQQSAGSAPRGRGAVVGGEPSSHTCRVCMALCSWACSTGTPSISWAQPHHGTPRGHGTVLPCWGGSPCQPRCLWLCVILRTGSTVLSQGLCSTSRMRSCALDELCEGSLRQREDKRTGSAGGCPRAVCYVSLTLSLHHTLPRSPYYPTSLSNGILCCWFRLTLTYFFLVSQQAVRSYQSTGSWNKHSLRGKARLSLVNLISFV